MTLMTVPIYTTEQIENLDKTRIPRHVAIIPDGNRRWAKQREEMILLGHQAGANALIEIVKAGKELGIKAMTFYLFSTENWNRSKEEVIALMWLLEDFLRSRCEEMKEHGVRLMTIGNLKALSSEVQIAIEETMESTADCKDIDMIFALNYGGRDDLCRAFHKILDEYGSKLNSEFLTESLISRYLDTAPWGDPDLLIRTSGEMRISNFLLWQLSYSEIHVTEALWPDFSHEDLLKAIKDFQIRDRRLGGP
ncbi:MAG: di-trans,poly-cis-decaprenylcistransferase [Parachlamydiaceae bacterium]|nr:di-trans,poly-cis-decaprenylcistransferase [Parachlamydiaceae bacterium]